MPSPILQAVDLGCTRGSRRLFQGLDFSVTAGEALRVQGENGVGKTSLLRILAGLSQPAEGQVRWRDQPLTKRNEEYSRELVFLGHANALKEELSPVQNLRAALALAGVACDERTVRDSLAQEGLSAAADFPVQWLSQGQRRRVALTRLALSGAQRLWILDEPFSALDPAAVQRVGDRIARHIAQGGLVVFTTHQEVRLDAVSRFLNLP
jgi:heme exporter protein A